MKTDNEDVEEEMIFKNNFINIIEVNMCLSFFQIGLLGVSLMGLTAILNHLWTRDEIEELKEKLKKLQENNSNNKTEKKE